MTINDKIKAFAELGCIMSDVAENTNNSFAKGYEQTATWAFHKNGWFTREFTDKAVADWGNVLKRENIESLARNYPEIESEGGFNVGLILAGNIPMVGFHDIFVTLLTGNRVHGKLSSKDALLIPFFMEVLTQIEPRFKERIQLDEHMQFSDIDAVIATGSDNSARYFEYYFGKYPHIIRRNRTSVAVLNGEETFEDLKHLGMDIFTYFGLGCRNVSKIYAPAGFETSRFFEAVTDFGFLTENKKYMNNYEYNRTLYLLNDEKGLLDNNFVILRETNDLHAPTGVVNIQYYEHFDSVLKELQHIKDDLQCIISKGDVPFGKSQQPQLTDFADNTDTVKFLTQLNKKVKDTI